MVKLKRFVLKVYAVVIKTQILFKESGKQEEKIEERATIEKGNSELSIEATLRLDYIFYLLYIILQLFKKWICEERGRL